MKQLFRLIHKCCLLSLATFLFCSSQTITIDQNQREQQTYYTVNKIKKRKNKVYEIYVQRNDTLYKIVSHYSGIKNKNEIKIVKGLRIKGTMHSIFKETEKHFNMLPIGNVAIMYFDCSISNELDRGLYDSFFFDEINGPYILKTMSE